MRVDLELAVINLAMAIVCFFLEGPTRKSGYDKFFAAAKWPALISALVLLVKWLIQKP
jgi:hypothetical protein